MAFFTYRPDGWPRLLISLALPTEWGAPSLRVLCEGAGTTMPAVTLLCDSIPKRNPRPAPIDSPRPSLSQKIETITAPAPLLRSFHQSAFHWVAMDVPQFLHTLLRGPHIKVIETSLPERAPTHLVCEQAALAQVASFAPG